jgi:hypothetical protein
MESPEVPVFQQLPCVPKLCVAPGQESHPPRPYQEA